MIDKIVIELSDEGAFIIRGSITICVYDRIHALKEINAQMSYLAFFKKLPNDCNNYSRKEYELSQKKIKQKSKQKSLEIDFKNAIA
jgi:hypothetical protein